MYKNEFDNYLKQNKRFKSYLFYGQSTFLIEQYSLAIAQMFGNSDEIEKMYFEEYDFKYAKDKLLQSSLFSSNNILLIKVEKKIPKKEVDSLVDACNKNPDSTLIFACLGDSEFKTMENSFSLKTNSVAVRFFLPTDLEALKFLEYEAKMLQIKYEISALNHLYFMHKSDLSLCVNDLRKLAILDELLTVNVIDNNCFGIGSVNFEEFLHDLISGKDISDDLSLILEEGMNEIFLLNQVTSFVQQLFMISSYARTIGQPNPKDILGFIPPKNVWEKKSKLAINIKPEIFQEILNYLLNIELELKSSKIDNQSLYLQSSLRKFTVLFR
ncbi:DNA polymerase III subunit delta [Arcobacter aquimarinus]|uniref:DNA polymerase III, delta subunit n=1 Tax=Arcobacter aquimarinus TaxID=1315211 RepID=A0AAE7B460_9BACT|nr:DNA polymerase III subunit delta [Arcobacter aquimarinus]MCB9097097.1 DNA polymerase III subunit delta [Arcobacter sp.]QKE25077.1 DNA polymerase III, delta subunit [Arcobacter aquimarinus]RXI36470.1 DNA polymerase III subunit delta [Arcobacter aquimarinus]